MGNLTAFLAQNAKQVENVKLVVSDRFTDEDGKPLEWEVRCISSREDETLRRDCQYRAEELISAMLTPGEYTNYTEKLFDICGFGDAPDLVEQAKN